MADAVSQRTNWRVNGFLAHTQTGFNEGFKGVCMKVIAAGCLAVAALLIAAPQTATAQHRSHGWHGDIRHFDRYDHHRWRSGAWRHGWHSGRSGWWWVAGGAWYYYPQPVYPYPDPYRPPILIEQAPVVVQIPAPVPVQVQPAEPIVAAPPVQQFWYYCDAAGGYYPYVASCPSGWKTVPATPPGASQ